MSWQCLEDTTLGLLGLLDVDVVPDHDGEDTNSKEAGSGDQHVSLSLTIRTRNRISGWATNFVRRLNDDAAVDLGEIGLRLGREIGLESGRINTSPDGSCDGATDCSSDAGKSVLNGKGDSNLLMSDGGHDSNLLTNNGCSTTQSDKHLTHDNEPDVDIWLTECDHQTNAENAQRNTKIESKPLVAARKSDQQTYDYRPRAGSKSVDVADKDSLGDGEIVDHDQE